MVAGPKLIKTSIGLALVAAGGRLIGAFLQIVLASQFGVSAKLDGFFVAFSLPALVSDWFLAAAPAIALVPIIARLRSSETDDEVDRFTGTFLTVLLGAVFLLIAIYLVFAESIVTLLAPGFRPEAVAGAAGLGRLLILGLLFGAGTGVGRALLHSRGRFFVSALPQTITSAVVIFSVWLFAERFDLYSITFGYLAGAGAALVLVYAALRRGKIVLRPALDFKSPHIKPAFALLSSFLLVGLGAQINFLSDRFFASMLAPGSISVLAYAEKFTILFTGVISMAVADPALVTLSGAAAVKSYSEIRLSLQRGLRLIALFTVPLWLGFIILRRPVVKLFFERGAFSGQDTEIVSAVILFLSVSFFVLAFSQLAASAFFALRDTKWLVGTVAAVIIFNILLNLAFYRPFGVLGIALSTSIANSFGSLTCWLILRRKLAGLGIKALGGFVLKIAAAAALMGAVVVGLGWLTEVGSASGGANLTGRIALAAGVGALVYLGAIYLLKVEEIRVFLDRSTGSEPPQIPLLETETGAT